MTFGLSQKQKGLTLIEVVLALGLLALIGVGILEAAQANTKASGIIDQQVTAQSLATNYIEAIKQSAFADNYAGATANITVPPQYNVAVTTFGTDNDTVWVGPPSSNQSLQKIVITISQSGKQIFTMCTFRARR